MSLKSLSDNLKSEDEFHTFVKSGVSDTSEHYLYNIFHKKCQTSFVLTNMKKLESQM